MAIKNSGVFESRLVVRPAIRRPRLLGAAALAASFVLGAGCSKKDAPAEASASAAVPAAPGRVLVTEDGFQPSAVRIKKGDKLIFRRTTDSTCAKAVVFPSLKIEKELPLNRDVVVELPPNVSGELGFQCGMGMYKSKVVVN